MIQNMISGYQCTNHHPHQSYPLDAAGSALHSVCAAKKLSWKEAYACLIQASGEIGQMPQYQKTIRKMLENQGFFLQGSGLFAGCSIAEIAAECSEIFHEGETLILKLTRSTVYGTYIPLIPEKEGAYILQYPENLLDSTAAEVWIAWKDGEDHSIKPRRKTTAKRSGKQTAEQDHETPENDALVVYNENPNSNLIGDCAVRAVAGVLEIPWEEAIRKLVEAQDYTETEINCTENIEAMLRKEGFQQFDAIRRNGRILTGKEFCDHIHDMFQAGTRIYAYIGNDHAAAILVFDNDYKIVDTWDSTNRAITKYWAKYPERPQRRPRKEAQNSQLTELAAGTKIRHKIYGTGEITALADAFATVRFSDNREKKFAVSWILANCKTI